MPIYEFRCKDCHAVTESISLSVANAPVSIKCSNCGSENTERIIASSVSHRMDSSEKTHIHKGHCCGGAGGGDCIPGSCCGNIN